MEPAVSGRAEAVEGDAVMTVPAATMDAAAVWPSGRVQLGRARPDRVQSAADAIDALAHGALCVYVARDDAETVREWAKGRVRSGENNG